MGPTAIDKSQPVESIGSRLRDHTRTFDSSVLARSNYRRTLLGEGVAASGRRARYRNNKLKSSKGNNVAFFARFILVILVIRNSFRYYS